jgi:hypothetical protein
MTLTTIIKKNPITSTVLGVFIVLVLLFQIVFYYESSNKLLLNDQGQISCKASGKYKVIQNPICEFSANLQGNLFLKNQLKFVLGQIRIRTTLEPILNEKINLTIKEYESKFSDELKVMDTLISDKRNRLKDLELEIKSPSPKNDKFRVEYDETVRSIPLLQEAKASSLKKLLETNQAKINDLKNELNKNPTELEKLKTLESIIRSKLNSQ